MEELSSYVISSLELQLTYVPTSFRSLGKLQLDQQHGYVFVMKIMIPKGVSPPTDGRKMNRLRPLSMFTLQASKSHSSKAPKSEPFLHTTSSSQGSATLMHTETVSPVPYEMQT